jgi:hypothetical protein
VSVVGLHVLGHTEGSSVDPLSIMRCDIGSEQVLHTHTANSFTHTSFTQEHVLSHVSVSPVQAASSDQMSSLHLSSSLSLPNCSLNRSPCMYQVTRSLTV